MPRPRNSFKHRDTAYNRPGQRYVCGHECEGKSCALGPDAKGHCRGDLICDDGRKAGECIPAQGQYNRLTGETTNKERWFCMRDSSRGGRCEDGPLPDGSCCLQLSTCSPAASLRRKRGAATILLASLTFAFVIILFASKPESLSHPLNPGPVSSAHSSPGTTCASCHDSSGGALPALADFHSDRAFLDAHRCADCHDEIGGEDRTDLLTAHTLPKAHLAKLSVKAQQRKAGATPFLVGLASRLGIDNEEIACASCHSEHHGTKVDLKYLSNSQCQVCHTDQFHSFSNGHPDFESYPYRRRTRIFFDHETHFSEYFKTDEFKQHAKQACADCHTEQPGGGRMLTGTFANTCAACHDSNTKFGSWEILAFPRIDVSRLQSELTPELTEKLAPWDSASSREISPLLSILLSEQEVESLYPLRKASDKQKQAAAAFSKLLVEEIYSDEAGKFAQRLLGSGLLADVEPEQSKRLGENLAAVFENLRAAAGEEKPVVSSTDSGGIYTYDPGEGSLAYQPSGHADPLMRAILDVSAAKVGKVDHAETLLGYASDFWQGFETTGAGKCLKCHTLDRRQDGSMRINWFPAPIDSAERPITKFKHRSHLRLRELVKEDAMPADEACAACHQVETAAAQVKSYREIFSAENHNPHHFHSGFKHLAVNNCAECHTENQAGNSCLQCHQYHATPSSLTPALAPIPIEKDKPRKNTDAEGDEEPQEGEEGGSDLLVPDDGGESLIPDDGGDSLIPDDGGDSLIPDDGGESLIPDDGGESLIPDDGGESLIPDDGGESLIPDDGGESLVPDDDGDSLLPGGEETQPGDPLVPEQESLLPPEDE